MLRTFRRLAATWALASLATTALASPVLNFDDLTGTDHFASLYNGLDFTQGAPLASGSWFFSDDESLAGANPLYKSDRTSLSTDFTSFALSDSAAILLAAPAVFEGAWFTVLEQDIPIQFDLYLDTELVWSSLTLTLDFDVASTFLSSGYGGLINGIVVNSYQGFFAMDDMTFGAVPVNIPEPTSAALALTALGGLLWMTRRRAHGREPLRSGGFQDLASVRA